MATRFRPAFALPYLLLLSPLAPAQDVDKVTISTHVLPPLPAIGGFGLTPLARSPMQAGVFDADTLSAAGVTSFAGLTRLDAGISDAYNAEGYWSFLTVRGFVLDNRSNYRRDGLPINAETSINLFNKSRIEVLKGTSGIQAGISAPGGLVNFVVKRPDSRVRDASIEWRQDATIAARVDLADRFGEDRRFGLRLNADVARLRPRTFDADGRRHGLALAGDWQVTPDSRIEAELESTHQSQPSVTGFSLRANTLPDADTVDPRINLNNQPWTRPVVLDGDTASLRWRQRLTDDWQLSAHGSTQRLRSDDYTAFPFGCAAQGNFDRFCADGSFDYYDFRRVNERRRLDAFDLQLSGVARTGGIAHDVSTGVLITRGRERFPRQAFNPAGTGRDDGSLVTPPAPELTLQSTNRDEHSTEWFVRDAMQLHPQWSLWTGLRHVRLHRTSISTDGTGALDSRQSFTVPWLALAHHWSEATTVYVSWGEGVETDVAPNIDLYTNAGQPLPALKSRQIEAGIKHADDSLDWSLTAFRITRPQAADIGACSGTASCTRQIDGNARHQGLEAALGTRLGAWTTRTSLMWLDAQRRGASDAALNGLRPTNVPQRTLKALVSYDVAGWPGLRLSGDLVHEGPRMVLVDNTIEAPGWTRLDLGISLRRRIGGATALWQLALDNATDERAWRETPYQFGHVYLFPLQPRTWRASLQVMF